MNYPSFDAEYQRRDELRETYSRFVREDTVEFGDVLRQDSPSEEKASIMAAQALVTAEDSGAAVQDVETWSSAHYILKHMRSIRKDPSRSLGANVLKATLNFIEDRDTKFVARRSRIAHRRAITALQGHVDMLSQNQAGKKTGYDTSEIIGSINEYTTLGLLTRMTHPRLLAVKSLRHQDQRRVAGGAPYNHDITVVEAGDTTTQLHKVQVKSHCFGECDKASQSTHKGKRPHDQYQDQQAAHQRAVTQLKSTKQQYDQSITLISACCDFNGHDLTTAQLLIKEQFDDITDEERGMLDTLTNTVLLRITAAPWRSGSLQSPDHAVGIEAASRGTRSDTQIRRVDDLNTADAARRMLRMFN